ncbi:DUF6766 family protein [Flavobacterium sp.]|uniref:DUF6766 family protein n=1 Tax=Flavobacterium sp. TaxID=239 RepID=UPI0038D4CA17
MIKKFLYQNSLFIVFLLLFAGAFVEEAVCGIKEYNNQLTEEDAAAVNMSQYLLLSFSLKIPCYSLHSSGVTMVSLRSLRSKISV